MINWMVYEGISLKVEAEVNVSMGEDELPLGCPVIPVAEVKLGKVLLEGKDILNILSCTAKRDIEEFVRRDAIREFLDRMDS